eukprot:CAMPEP_0172498864 /NCGR_PEP_ID=MMETSP1066-20121228/118538_1 /TAXON_ID=671091 /ORGANISM="Coscinodiscus wailesii, Strain CCMP2513" /LENGTH=317 /DNA_ID=CAMNT_0013272313 /DNA_START=166 /DNA_END=1119 /DNA_ORIENTATION=+
MSKEETDEKKPFGTEFIETVVKPVVEAITIITPHAVKYFQLIYHHYQKLPTTHIQIIFGSILCFFGGIYPTLFAAFEAAKHGGIKDLQKAVTDLTNEALIIIEESKKDDKVDANGDGVADVLQISDQEYVLRKSKLVMTKITPSKVDNALQKMFTVWIAVVATLKVRFARTIALSMTISDVLKRPANAYLTPVIEKSTPKEYQKWIPVIIGWITKGIGMSIAWFIQTIISAATSAWEGALIISRAGLKLCEEKGIKLSDVIPENIGKTSIDETIAYGLAFVGFYSQWKLGFDMPFPFNIVLMPFEIAEYYIRWTISD